MQEGQRPWSGLQSAEASGATGWNLVQGRDGRWRVEKEEETIPPEPPVLARGSVKAHRVRGWRLEGKLGPGPLSHSGPSCLTAPACLQVYPSSSGEDYGRDSTAYAPAKAPSSAYPPPFYMAGAWGLTPEAVGAAGPLAASHHVHLHRWQPAPRGRALEPLRPGGLWAGAGRGLLAPAPPTRRRQLCRGQRGLRQPAPARAHGRSAGRAGVGVWAAPSADPRDPVPPTGLPAARDGGEWRAPGCVRLLLGPRGRLWRRLQSHAPCQRGRQSPGYRPLCPSSGWGPSKLKAWLGAGFGPSSLPSFPPWACPASGPAGHIRCLEMGL